jgi:transcriptional regulator of acetoin/glycerol metabolism
MESILIIEAMRRNKGNQTAAAMDLGIDKSTLYRKLKAYNIKPQAGR